MVESTDGDDTGQHDTGRDVRFGGVQELLLSIERPGDYCVGGRTYVAMPKLTVEGVGTLSFPVPEPQLRALVDAASVAPYGKGPETLVDRSVRNCRQIDAEMVGLSGRGWPDSFDEIMDDVARGLGLSRDLLDAELYKLLVYEPGGFFSAHRDTEKSDGMIATLSVTLPTHGLGGDLVVRHGDRETFFNMNADEPSEVAYAAFYADCSHEVLPVVEGHRVSLVFNLCLRSPGVSPMVPDYDTLADRVAEGLSAWQKEGATDKLVWVLDHAYSEEGLSFDTLKGVDATRALVLAQAVDRAGCELHAAILHIEEYGSPVLELDYDRGRGDSWVADYSDSEIEDIIDEWRWLDGWTARNGNRPPFGRVPLEGGELLPSKALDDVEPDERRLEESFGNEGATLELIYRLAAFVVWPGSKTLDIVASGSMDGATRAEMLRFLSAAGDREGVARFAHGVVLPRYDGTENEALADVVDMLGPEVAAQTVSALVGEHLARRRKAIPSLLTLIGDKKAGREVARRGARAALLELPKALSLPDPDLPKNRGAGEPTSEPLDHHAVRDLLLLAGRFDLMTEAETAARAITDHPGHVAPERVIPAALAELSQHREVANAAPARHLWRTAADALLARSSTPPDAPRDWMIEANLPCKCEHCAALRLLPGSGYAQGAFPAEEGPPPPPAPGNRPSPPRPYPCDRAPWPPLYAHLHQDPGQP